jgi:dCMP deaminase
VIIQSGISEVLYLNDKYAETDGVKASKKMLGAAGVKCTQLKPAKKTIEIKFE